MNRPKIYKFNKNQMKLIVESQKSSPQLQTEILDQTADAFGKFLTFGFRQSANIFKYFTGIGVNVFFGTQFTPTGKVPIKKNNPLAPLSLYKPTLTELPTGYEKLFETVAGGIKTIDATKEQGQDNQDKDTNKEEESNQTLKQLKFDDVDQILYRIKFEFQNLQKNAKENQSIMATTWGLIFKAKCSGNITETNQITFTLVGFTSQGPSAEQYLSALTDKDKNAILKMVGTSGKGFSLIFSDQSQAAKFAKVMKTQIDKHMKVIIGNLNADMGVNVIKVPTVDIVINPTLIGDSKIQPQNQPVDPNQLAEDIKTITEKIKEYQNNTDTNSQTFLKQLRIVLNRLVLKQEELKQKNK